VARAINPKSTLGAPSSVLEGGAFDFCFFSLTLNSTQPAPAAVQPLFSTIHCISLNQLILPCYPLLCTPNLILSCPSLPGFAQLSALPDLWNMVQCAISLSPLSATFTGPRASVANKRLTFQLSPLDATFTKNQGGTPYRLAARPNSSSTGVAMISRTRSRNAGTSSLASPLVSIVSCRRTVIFAGQIIQWPVR